MALIPFLVRKFLSPDIEAVAESCDVLRDLLVSLRM